MAKTGRHTTSRRSSQSMYVDGNTVRKVQEVPVKREYRQPEHSVRKKQARPALGPGQELTRQGKSLSRDARRNRAKANSMNRNFAIFLGVLGGIVVNTVLMRIGSFSRFIGSYYLYQFSQR